MSFQAHETRHVGGGMPTTRWSIVQALGGGAKRRQEALEVFAENYWPAVYGFIRMKGHSPQEAEDLTQSFLAGLIEREVFEDLSEQKGRFRSWLLASLTNFLRNDSRDRRRLKRGGDVDHLSIDRDLGEAWLEASSSDDASPDVVFDRNWASGILERALAQLTDDYQRQGRLEVVQILAPMIAGLSQRIGYAEAGEKLGMSEQTARAAAFRMRKRLRKFVRDEVAVTVGGSADVDAEIDQLFAIFGPS
jgi:RNA polymerase sigma factor (sigma-70 family)